MGLKRGEREREREREREKGEEGEFRVRKGSRLRLELKNQKNGQLINKRGRLINKSKTTNRHVNYHFGCASSISCCYMEGI